MQSQSCRLSKDDGENKVSESIENQMKLIREYVTKSEDLEIADIYIDDGYSGLYFANRPEFQRMMEDIYKGKIQGVITKDISRLGREHIETSNYIERVFPSLGVRYIAILDGVDSVHHSNEELAQFKTLFNDMYSRDIQFTGSCQCAYHYVASCTVKWVNDKLLTFFKDAGLDGKAGWQLFKEKEYLGKLDNQKEVEKLLEQYILRFERDPKEEPELSRFHLFDAKGNVKGVRDMEIVDYLVENVQFFVVGITPYYYEHGVFLEDHDGVRMKYRIQKLIYRDQVQSGVIKRIYNLLIAQPKVHREAYELNKQPVRWINFKNGYYDPVTGEMLEHNPDYLTINQIPFPYYPEDCEQVLQGGENIKKYLASSLPNKEEQQTFWEYFGYCMTQDTQFQKFLTLKGNGGTGKSVAVSLIQHVVGITNMSSISLQDLNKRFYATGMYGKLLNACADIPCKAMENTDVLKKAVGEDTLIYEKKGQDAIHFHSYAKLLFSTNEMPQNLEDKSDAFYRRLLILDMNRVVKSGEKDLHLKEKVQAESDYAIHMAMIALKNLYEQGKFTESEHSKECVREVQRTSDSICAFIDESLVRANRYYDNPDTQMHVLLQFLFAKVGINIDALG